MCAGEPSVLSKLIISENVRDFVIKVENCESRTNVPFNKNLFYILESLQ